MESWHEDMSLVYLVLYVEKFLLHLFLYLLVCKACGICPYLVVYHPSVLLHCWLDHLTCKIVSEMTYNVSIGMLNPTIILA